MGCLMLAATLLLVVKSPQLRAFRRFS